MRYARRAFLIVDFQIIKFNNIPQNRKTEDFYIFVKGVFIKNKKNKIIITIAF